MFELIAILALIFAFRKTPGDFEFPFNAHEIDSISQINPSEKKRFKAFIIGVRDLGYYPIFTSIFRSFSYQQALYNNPDYTANPPGYSYHNYGLAFDLNLESVTKDQYINSNSSISQWEATGVPNLAESIGIRWGGKVYGAHEVVHFDFGNDYSINALAAAAGY